MKKLTASNVLTVSIFISFLCSPVVSNSQDSDSSLVEIATFDVDATPPVGSAMAYDPVKRLDELTLRCRGIVLRGAGKPIVLCAVDWIGIANEGHDAFRDALAAAAGTTRDHVAVHALHQLHALYALQGLNALTAEDLVSELSARSSGVREHAVRLAESSLPGTSENGELTAAKNEKATESIATNLLTESILALANDASDRVRYQVAFSLGEFDRDRRAAQALAALARRDAGDIWMRTAILSSSVNLAADILGELMADGEFLATTASHEFLRQLALVVGGRNQQAEVVGILKQISEMPATKSIDARESILLGLGDGLRRSGTSLSRYLGDSSFTVAKLLANLLESAKQTVMDASSSASQQQRAIEILAHGRYEEVRDTIVPLLDSRQTPANQLAAIQALGRMASTAVATDLIECWQRLSPTVRGEVIETLLSRSEWTNALLDAVENKSIPSSYIPPVRQSQLTEHTNSSICKRAEALLSKQVLGSRKEVVEGFRSALDLRGDAGRGQKVYEQNCMACHKVRQQGHEVGPNLATIQNRTPEALMVQILDPNHEVLANYTQYMIMQDDGRVISGLIASESPTSLTIKRAENVQEIVLRQNIEEIIGSGKSLMPEGLEKNINAQQMSDLLAFLLEIPQ